MGAKIYFSNECETLCRLLEKNLFLAPPFSQKIVIVGNVFLKNRLQIKITESSAHQVAFGFRIITSDMSLNDATLGKRGSFPGRMELIWRLEVKLEELVGDFAILPAAEKEMIKPLYDYLMEDNLYSAGRVDRRRAFLAEKLADLFYQYNSYGKKMIAKWQKDVESGWQALLWKSVIGQKREDCLETLESGCQIHIFVPDFLSRSQYDLFLKLSSRNSLFIYHLSPCRMFWSDILSDKEEARFTRDDFLLAKNSFLANLGKLSRQTGSLLEETIEYVDERYSMPESVLRYERYKECLTQDIATLATGGELTLLEALRADLLLMPNSVKLNLPFDKTIQVHIAATKYREIEILHNNILDAIKEKEVDLGDIVVLAPNIEEYAPFIKSVFTGGEYPLDYNIRDLSVTSISEIARAFLHLINMAFGKWDAQSLLDLLSFAPIRKRAGLKENDVVIFTEWVRVAGIKWGRDLEDKKEYLENRLGMEADEISDNGSWQRGFQRLMLGVCFMDLTAKGSTMLVSSAADIDSTEAPLLGKFMSLENLLWKRLRPLRGEKKRSLREWSEYLKSILSDFFQASGPGERDDLSWLSTIIDGLATANIERQFSFTTIKYHLERTIGGRKGVCGENGVNAITFADLDSANMLFFKVVALIGLDEPSFPGKEEKTSLDLLRREKGVEWRPTTKDMDRGYFLRAILTTRERLLISYVGYSIRDRCQIDSSSVVRELLGYLDQNFEINGRKPSVTLIRQHPFKSFDSLYFIRGSSLVNYSEKNYRAAESFYNPVKRGEHVFIDGFQLPVERKEVVETVKLSDLLKMAGNPIRSYFNHTLNIYFNEKSSLTDSEDSVAIPAIDKYFLLKEAFSTHFAGEEKEVLKKAVPLVGSLGECFLRAVEMKAEETVRKLDVKNIFTLECSRERTAYKIEGKSHLFPPLAVSCGGKTINIVGKIGHVCDEGLCLFTGRDVVKLIRHWPEYLVFCCLIRKFSLPISEQVIFVNGGNIKKININDPFLLLSGFLDYYFSALKNASPLIPELVPEIVVGDGKNFADRAARLLKREEQYSYNEYLKWLVPESGALNVPNIVKNWQKVAEEQFGELIKQWKQRL